MMNFDNLFNYSLYCQYKDLEGVYCDSCRKWLIYGEKTENKPFYIINKKLKPCSDCVTVRNGNYPYLSDFSMFIKAFNKSENKVLKQEIINLFRSNGKERFVKKHITYHSVVGCEIEFSRRTYGKMLIINKRFKCIPDVIIEHEFRDAIIGKVIGFDYGSDINYDIIATIQQIAKIQRERPIMKYIVIKEFGSIEEKMKLYNHHKSFDILLEDISFEMFWDDFGLHYLMSFEDLVFNNEILDSIKNQDMIMMLHLYDYELHWSERVQHYYKRRFYKPKRFNIHKLGYY